MRTILNKLFIGSRKPHIIKYHQIYENYLTAIKMEKAVKKVQFMHKKYIRYITN